MARFSRGLALLGGAVLVLCFESRKAAGTLTEDGEFEGNHYGSCVCQQSCSGTDQNNSLIYHLLSTLSSTQATQTTLLNRAVSQLEQLNGQQISLTDLTTALQSTASSLETKMTAQYAIIRTLQGAVDRHTQQMALLQPAIDKLTPPAHYQTAYPVFHVASGTGTYQLTLTAARALCASMDAKLATLPQLEAAWKHGMNVCACGWLDDASVRYPIQWPRSGCGGGAAGLRVCINPGVATDRMFDAYCSR